MRLFGLLPGVNRILPPLVIAAASIAATFSALAGDDGVNWKVASKASDVTVFERQRKGSSLREFKAVGMIAMPPIVVRRVLDDVEEFPKFVPYLSESRVISRNSHSRVSYQRVSPPLMSDRDYTIAVQFETRRTPSGAAGYCNRWKAANELGPPEKHGVTRVKVTEGYWLLDPAVGGSQTCATYCIFSDAGKSLPAFIVNSATRTAIPKLFDAIRKQALLPKYSAAK